MIYGFPFIYFGIGIAIPVIIGAAIYTAIVLLRRAPPPVQQNQQAAPPPPVAPAPGAANPPQNPAPNPPAPNPARAPAANVFLFSNTNWDRGVRIALAAVAIAALLWFFFGQGTPALTTRGPSNGDPWTIVLALLVAGAMILAFKVGNRMKLVTFAFVTILLLFVAAQYKYGGLEIGYRRDLLYLLAIAAVILVLTYATTFKEKLTFGILVGAVFLMLGFSHIYSWDQFTTKLASIGWSDGGNKKVVFQARTGCGGSEQMLLPASQAVDISKHDGACPLRIKHPGKCISLRRASWTNDSRWYGPYCDTGGDEYAPNDIQYAYSPRDVVILVQR